METIYRDIAMRTGGDIYIGVVGPVRTGKSTFIKRFMEQLVIPNIEDSYRQERATDELPQSGSGKTIMTAEPKFVPEQAVEISPDGTTQLRVRMIDSVGYMVDGAVGAEENGEPRMVTTPWFDTEIPMTQAAELGTQKVMQEHCTIGIVITTDGSVTDIPREDYISAEHRAITDMQATGKPFLVIVNSRNPGSEGACRVQRELREQFGIEAQIADCQSMDSEKIGQLVRALLYNFPVNEVHVFMPRWLEALEPEHPVRQQVYDGLLEYGQNLRTAAQAEEGLQALCSIEPVQSASVRNVDLSKGIVCCRLDFPDALFYEILSQKTGITIKDDADLMQQLLELSRISKEYSHIADALQAAKATGYGVVMPAAEEMQLEKPEMIRKGGAFGVKLKAGAPSIHMIRVDIDTEISPIVGEEKQSQDLIAYLTGEEPEKLWQSNIFGKSVYELIQDGLTSKLVQLPEEVRSKFRGTLCRIVNEGANGLICLIL